MYGTSGNGDRFDLFSRVCHWHIVDEPPLRTSSGRASAALPVLVQSNVSGIGLVSELRLPGAWPLAKRSYVVATMIALDRLTALAGSQPDRVAAKLYQQVQRQQVAETLAHRLLVARPLLEHYRSRHGDTVSALRQLATFLTVPYESVEYMARAVPDPLADQVHQFVLAKTGYPWFLPPAIRDQYDRSKW